MASISIFDCIMQNLHTRNNIALCIDFRNAFDAVNHLILLDNLQKYVVRGHALKWFTNYLQNHCQFDSFKTSLSFT